MQIFLLVFIFSIGFVFPAYAYIDPGAGSILLQAIIGGVAASIALISNFRIKVIAWLKSFVKYDK